MYKKFLLIGSGNFVDGIKSSLSGLALEIEIANVLGEIDSKLKKTKIDLIVFDADSYAQNPQRVKSILTHLRRSKIPFVVLSSKKTASAVLAAKKLGAADYIVKPYNTREINLKLSAVLNRKKQICCIGGGSGLFNLLLSIKGLPAILPIPIVSTTDDGGSSGMLSESFGILPPGDIHRSLVALSNAPEIMNEIIQYRFSKKGRFRGHNFGDILLTVLNKIEGTMSDAVKSVGDILNINGIVYPVACTESRLCALFENGTVVKGERSIDLCKGRPARMHIVKCWHELRSKCDINAYSAIINSDIVTIGPGDLYTSVITKFLIKDIRRAIVETKAKKIYLCNLMTKPGETYGYNAFDHIKEIIKYLKQDCLDFVIIADHRVLSKKSLARYARKKQFPVEIGNLQRIKIGRAHV
jgi:uncharacterized cofD-like protein